MLLSLIRKETAPRAGGEGRVSGPPRRGRAALPAGIPVDEILARALDAAGNVQPFRGSILHRAPVRAA